MYVVTNHLKQFYENVGSSMSTKQSRRCPHLQNMVDLVEKAFQIISDDKDMIMKSFDICGITTTDPSEVRSGEFYSKCMEKAIIILDSDFTEDDPFTL